MKVVMLVPRREDHGHRDRVWAWVKADLEGTWPWPIIEGHHDEGMWNQPAAYNRAAQEAGDWDVAIFSDADVVSPGWGKAVELAVETGSIVMPHTNYCYLSEEGTEQILAGRDYPRPELVEWSQENLCVAQCVVTRELWERVGGQDERFAGHSHSDVAFYYACRGLAGEQRVEGPLWHLFHPIDTTTPPENQAMCGEYLNALQENRMADFLASRPTLSIIGENGPETVLPLGGRG